MKTIHKLALLCTVIFTLTGCMPAAGVKMDVASVSTIVRGKTTKQEVLAKWGQPMMRSFARDGENWMYVYQSTIHPLSIFTGVETQNLSIAFSGDIVADFTFGGVVDPVATQPPMHTVEKTTPQLQPKPGAEKVIKKK